MESNHQGQAACRVSPKVFITHWRDQPPAVVRALLFGYLFSTGARRRYLGFPPGAGRLLY